MKQQGDDAADVRPFSVLLRAWEPKEGADISSIIALLLHPKPEEGASISCIIARALRLERLQSPEKGPGNVMTLLMFALSGIRNPFAPYPGFGAPPGEAAGR